MSFRKPATFTIDANVPQPLSGTNQSQAGLNGTTRRPAPVTLPDDVRDAGRIRVGAALRRPSPRR